MVTINASPERSLQLGYAGEDKVTKVIFPYNESWLEYGDGEFFIRVLRPGDTEPYNAQDVTNDSEAMTLTLVVTDVELSRQGYGQMQVVYIGPQVVKKSRIYAYRVSKAIDEPVDPPNGSIINQIVQSLGDLSDLTTTAKSDLVSAINEVNNKSVDITVDDALSATSENPVQNKVVTSAIQSKADTATVSALSDAVQDLDGDVQGLQTGLASKVGDVQINGASIVTDGVAEIPIANNNSKFGIVRYHSDYGITSFYNTLAINAASLGRIKAGISDKTPIVPSNQHQSVFFALAKVAGHEEKNSALPVGTYSEEAKSAISDMLNGAVLVEGTTPTITALSGVRYVCGQVATLDFTPCATGICDVVFTSGSIPTVVTLPDTVKFPYGLTVEANKTYEINILDGVYGVVMAWT